MVRLWCLVCIPFLPVGQEECEAWNQDAEDQVAMLQGRVDLLSRDLSASEEHRSRQAQSNVKKKTDFMLETVRRLAKDMSGDVLSTLALLRSQVNQLIDVLNVQHDIDWNLVNNQKEEVEACLQAYDIQESDARVKNTCLTCSTCQSNLLADTSTSEAECRAWNDLAKLVWNEMTVCRNDIFAETFDGPGTCGNGEFQGSHDLMQAMELWQQYSDEMIQKRDACISASDSCVECVGHVNNFTSSYCAMREDCGMQRACFDHEKLLYDAEIRRVHVSPEPLQRTVQQQSYLMHRQILCIVDLINARYLSNQTVSDTELLTCDPGALRDQPQIRDSLVELDIEDQNFTSPVCVVPECQESCSEPSTPDCPQADAAVQHARTRTFQNGQLVSRIGVGCWTPCGLTGGYCDWCGLGNACCRENFDDPDECDRALFAGMENGGHRCVTIEPS